MTLSIYVNRETEHQFYSKLDKAERAKIRKEVSDLFQKRVEERMQVRANVWKKAAKNENP